MIKQWIARRRARRQEIDAICARVDQSLPRHLDDLDRRRP